MRLKEEKGQAMVEFALVLPILIALLCSIIDFGWIFGNQLMADYACREAARYTAVHYYDSSTDNDQTIAAAIVSERAPLLVSPIVTVAQSGTDDAVTVTLDSSVAIITPVLSALFADGQYEITAQCVMRLE